MSGEFWAAVAGAVVGGLIAALLQLLAAELETRRRRADRLEQKQALAYGLIFKVGRIVSNLTTMSNAWSAAGTPSPKSRNYWTKVRGPANSLEKVTFDASELALLYSLNTDVFNRAVMLDDFHNAVIGLADRYRATRDELLAALEINGIDPDSGRVDFDQASLAKTVPQQLAADSLARDLVSNTEEARVQAAETFGHLAPLFREKLEMKVHASLK